MYSSSAGLSGCWQRKGLSAAMASVRGAAAASPALCAPPAACVLPRRPRAMQPWGQPTPAQQRQQQLEKRSKQLHQAQQRPGRASVRVAAAADGSGSGAPQQQPPPPPKGSIWTWFDSLPPRVQMGTLGVLAFVGLLIVPFFQPTFLYGDRADSAGSKHAVTDVAAARAEEAGRTYQLPRYIPVVSELYGFLQDNAMPRKTPDGRSESPGVLRIYASSMLILALFYCCSAVLSLVLRTAAAALRAVGLIGPEQVQKRDDN